jgi:hypothetical protein
VPAGKLLQETSWNHQNKEENKNVNNGENGLTLSVDHYPIIDGFLPVLRLNEFYLRVMILQYCSKTKIETS